MPAHRCWPGRSHGAGHEDPGDFRQDEVPVDGAREVDAGPQDDPTGNKHLERRADVLERPHLSDVEHGGGPAAEYADREPLSHDPFIELRAVRRHQLRAAGAEFLRNPSRSPSLKEVDRVEEPAGGSDTDTDPHAGESPAADGKQEQSNDLGSGKPRHRDPRFHSHSLLVETRCIARSKTFR